MKVQTIVVGDLEANCHIVSDAAGQAVLIDPGAQPQKILAALRAAELRPLAMLLTHAHFDHFGAAPAIQAETGIPLYVHTLDRPYLVSAAKSLAVGLGYGREYQEPQDIRTFEANETLSFSEELTFTAMHTPGHTPGGTCFLHGNLMFSGDTLFRDSIGRVDFPGGNIHDMRTSLARLGALAGDYEVYCGHFGNTTLAHERKFNHYVNPELPKR